MGSIEKGELEEALDLSEGALDGGVVGKDDCVCGLRNA